MKTIVCRENSCSFEVKAPKTWDLKKVKIDGDAIKDNKTERCDYAVIASKKSEKNSIFYIELKGTDLRKAISQLESTINKFNNSNGEYANKYARAVCSRIIPSFTSESQVAVYRFKKKYSFCLKWHSQKGEFHIKEQE